MFPPSTEQAIYHIRLAAGAGIADAQYDLGVLLLPTHAEEAVRYFKLAAEQGNADAKYNLGLCYVGGMGVAPSREEAIRYLELAVAQKQPKAAQALELVLMTFT